MSRATTPSSASPGRRHDPGHTDESGYGPAVNPLPAGGHPGDRDRDGDGHGLEDQGAGGVQGHPQRSPHAGYPGMHEDPYAGNAQEDGSYSGPYTGHGGGRMRPRSPSYGRWDEPGQDGHQGGRGDSDQDDPHPGYSGDAWADRDWQHDVMAEPSRQPTPEAQAHPAARPRPAQQQQGGGGQTSVGAGPGERLQVSGLDGEPGAQNASPPPEVPPAGASDDAPPRAAAPGKAPLGGGHNASVPGQGRDNGRGLGG